MLYFICTYSFIFSGDFGCDWLIALECQVCLVMVHLSRLLIRKGDLRRSVYVLCILKWFVN